MGLWITPSDGSFGLRIAGGWLELLKESISKSLALRCFGCDTSRVSVLHRFDFGRYKLDDTIGDFSGLVEFSTQEYADIKRTFKGERIYNAPPVEFLGRSWQLILSIVQGKVRKIAVLSFLPNNEQVATTVAAQALQYCKERLGAPAEQKTGFFVWDTKDGNVVMQTRAAVDGFLINIFLTSASVQQLEIL